MRLPLLASLIVCTLLVSTPSIFASTPVVTVTSPANGSQDSSPVNFKASASSPQCSAGIAAMRIYTAPGENAYTVNGSEIDTQLALANGTYNAVVQAWDNCGGVGKTAVTITVSANALPAPKFVYTTGYNTGQVAGYLVNAQTGALTFNGQTPVWAHWGPTRVVSDTGGYRLYVANQGSHDVSAYFIDRRYGWLYPVPGANFLVAGWTTGIAVHPSNKFVYVTSNSSGSENGGQSGISALSVQSNGSLAPVPGSPVSTGPQYAIAVDPTGQYLFTSGALSTTNGTSVVYAFSIDQNSGALTPAPGSPFEIVPVKCKYCYPSEVAPDLMVDRTGHYVVLPGYLNGVIYVYRIDRASGMLNGVPGSPFIDREISCPAFEYCTSAAPTTLTFDPTNQHLFVENQSDNNIVGYTFNQTTGSLAFVSKRGSPYSAFDFYSYALRSDPSGYFLYTFGYDFTNPAIEKGAIVGYSINSSSATLSLVPNAPYPVYEKVNDVLLDGIVVTP